MSDLQIVLIIIGGLIIIAVLVFNWWQERRFHQQVDNNFSNIKSDALFDETALDSNTLSDANDPFDDGFAINHDFIQEISITEVEQRLEPSLEPEIDIQGQALYGEPETALAQPLPAQESALKSVDAAMELMTDNEFTADANAEINPVNHDGIKAIFAGAFSKNIEADKTEDINQNQQQSTDSHQNQPDDASQQEVPAQNLPAILHEQVDLIAVLHLALESTLEACVAALNSDFETYDKPVFIHVQTPDLRWLLLSEVSFRPEFSTQKISKIACSLQLADRTGPVSRSVVNRFQLAVESLGLDMNAHVEWQSAGDPVADAAALDTFCIDVDKTMGFHLLHGENGAFTGTKLRGLAEAQGLELAADGTFKYYDEATKKQAVSAAKLVVPSFVMFNRDQYPFSQEMLRSSVIKGITFQLDIPHVSQCTEAYNHMVQVAKQMETGLHAQLVDDNDRPLGDVQIDKIRHQLKIIQATMLTRNIIPGSDVAHRLFS